MGPKVYAFLVTGCHWSCCMKKKSGKSYLKNLDSVRRMNFLDLIPWFNQFRPVRSSLERCSVNGVLTWFLNKLFYRDIHNLEEGYLIVWTIS